MNENIECRATRRGRTWVVHVPGHEVYGHGRTLKAVHENTVRGLALLNVAADITITPVTPELEALRDTEARHMAALRDAVTALALRRTTLRDIASATGVPTTHVKRILAERPKNPVEDEYPETLEYSHPGH